MLNRLLPEQVAKFWPIIKYAIEESLPPIAGESPNKMHNILSAALSGKIDVWASYSKKDGVAKLNAIMLTEFLYDIPTDTKNLLIYCIYGYSEVPPDEWLSSLIKLAKYAKSRNCSQIIAYSDVESVIKFVNKLGADTRYTFISIDVDKIIPN